MRDPISAREAAGIIKVSLRRVQKLIQDGRLPAKRIGNQFLIERSAAQRFEDGPKGIQKKFRKKPE